MRLQLILTISAVMVFGIVISVSAVEPVQNKIAVKYEPYYNPCINNDPKPDLNSIFDYLDVSEEEQAFPLSLRPDEPPVDVWWDLDDWDDIYEETGLFDWFVLSYNDDISPEDAEGMLETTDYFLEVNPIYPLEYYDTFPNDPGFNNQWYLYDTNMPDGDINAVQGWDYLWSVWDPLVRIPKVGIIDSGIWSSNSTYNNIHPDIKANVNGDYIGDLEGYFPQDYMGHGTAVAGVASAVTNNNYKVAGVPWNKVKLICVSNFDGYGGADPFRSARCIIFCVNHGVDVINMSWGGTYCVALDDAIDFAEFLQVSMVAAFDNTGQSKPVDWPASDPRTIGVAGSDHDGDFSYYSSWTPNKVHCIAPCEDIYTTVPNYVNNNLVEYVDGNSFAAPQVSSIVALIRAKKSRGTPHLDDWSKDELRKACEHPGNKDSKEGYGRVSLFKALAPFTVISLPGNAGTYSEDTVISSLVNTPNPATGETAFEFSLSEGCTANVARLDIYDISGRRVAAIKENLNGPGEYSILWDTNSVAAGLYFYKLQAGDTISIKKMIVK